MSARGNYKKRKNRNKHTLKYITTKITGYKENDSCFEAIYQEIKRIRKLCDEGIPAIEINNLKEDYENKVMFIEYVYKFSKYKDILNKRKYKEKLTNEELIDLCLLLQYTDLYKKLDLDSEEIRETFKFATYLGHIDGITEGIRKNLIELFVRDSKLAIEYAIEYVGIIDIYLPKVRQKIIHDLFEYKRREEVSEEVKKKEKILLEEIDENLIYIDCEGKMRHEIDLSQYDDLSNIILYNCGDIKKLINKKANK